MCYRIEKWIRNNWRVLLTYIGVIAISLLGVELLARAFLSAQPTPSEMRAAAPKYEPARFTFHPIARSPDVILNNRWWGSRRWPINRHGYRGRDFSFGKPKHVIRIVIYGGSSVFDMALDDDDDWPHQVERILRGRFPRCDTEVINAGIPGHASHDSLGYFMFEGHMLAPDIVILNNYWNDIKRFHEKDPLLRTEKPYGGMENDPFTSYFGLWDFVLSESSFLYLKVRTGLIIRSLSENIQRKIFGDMHVNNLKQVLPIAEEAVRQYEMNLLNFVDIARNVGAVPMLVKQARLARSDNTKEERAQMKYHVVELDHDTILEAYSRMDEVVDSVASRKNVLVVDANRMLTPGGLRYLSDPVHLTEEGSRELASLVADQLSALYAPPSSRVIDSLGVGSGNTCTFSKG